MLLLLLLLLLCVLDSPHVTAKKPAERDIKECPLNENIITGSVGRVVSKNKSQSRIVIADACRVSSLLTQNASSSAIQWVFSHQGGDEARIPDVEFTLTSTNTFLGTISFPLESNLNTASVQHHISIRKYNILETVVMVVNGKDNSSGLQKILSLISVRLVEVPSSTATPVPSPPMNTAQPDAEHVVSIFHQGKAIDNNVALLLSNVGTSSLPVGPSQEDSEADDAQFYEQGENDRPQHRNFFWKRSTESDESHGVLRRVRMKAAYIVMGKHWIFSFCVMFTIKSSSSSTDHKLLYQCEYLFEATQTMQSVLIELPGPQDSSDITAISWQVLLIDMKLRPSSRVTGAFPLPKGTMAQLEDVEFVYTPLRPGETSTPAPVGPEVPLAPASSSSAGRAAKVPMWSHPHRRSFKKDLRRVLWREEAAEMQQIMDALKALQQHTHEPRRDENRVDPKPSNTHTSRIVFALTCLGLTVITILATTRYYYAPYRPKAGTSPIRSSYNYSNALFFGDQDEELELELSEWVP